MKDQITKLFVDVGKHYRDKGKLLSADVKRGHDIHAFYRLTQNPSQVIHIQGYPAMSNEDGVKIFARMMNYQKMMDIRKYERVSPGNEHAATSNFFINFDLDTRIPCKPEALEEKLEEVVAELRDCSYSQLKKLRQSSIL